MNEPTSPRVVIAEDHQLVLEGLVRILQKECQIDGVVNNGRDAVSLSAYLRPDILLLDITLPGLNGIEAARQLTHSGCRTKVLFVTMQVGREYVHEAFEAGGSGYVLKQSASSELIAAMREVMLGNRFVSPIIAKRYVLSNLTATENPSKLFKALTPRQREVLQLVAEGKSAKEIGTLLYISAKTVEFHKKQLMEELKLRTSTELVRYAVEEGWVAS